MQLINTENGTVKQISKEQLEFLLNPERGVLSDDHMFLMNWVELEDEF